MDQPIQHVLSSLEVVGRLQKWSIELGEYAIHYRPRVSVKEHILADFILKRPEEDSSDTLMETEEELPEPWILFDATNNKVEYEALIVGLRIAEQMGVKNLQANVDSRLVANQVNGTYVAKEADMIWYLEKVKTLTSGFKAFSIRQVSRSEVEILAVVEEEEDTWMTPIFKYLEKGTLLADVTKARATNGLVERANHSLGEGIKARLDARSKNWMEELPHVLWAHHTMIKSSNGDTPFSLTKKEEAAIREARSKTKMEKYYNAKVRNISFKPGDLVYRNNDASRAEYTGKLGPKWEGPYEVTEALRKRAYKLRDRNGKHLSRSWNISNLKKFYVQKM
ncbi:reverse transcriptase domain-containing protein [Tanacetum coccineum]